MTVYDTLIVGGGPAGLSAAIHLAWHRRRVLVLDRRTGPLFFTLEKLYNVPGMPERRGIDIQKELLSQATNLGAEVVRGSVTTARKTSDEVFELEGEKGEVWRAETILLATGVARFHPTVDGDYRPCFKYAGKGNLYYCPDCESPEVFGKRTLVIGVGKANSAGHMALGLSRYTDRLEILLTGDTEMSAKLRERLIRKDIGVRSGKIEELDGERSMMAAVVLEGGERIEAEAFFVSSPARGRTDLAQQLGVEMAPTGHHAQPLSQRGDTNVPGVWIAGDLRPMSQQVSVAMGTGNIAALMIDQHLRRRDVRRAEQGDA